MGKYEILCSILIVKALWIPHHIPNYKKSSKEIGTAFNSPDKFSSQPFYCFTYMDAISS